MANFDIHSNFLQMCSTAMAIEKYNFPQEDFMIFRIFSIHVNSGAWFLGKEYFGRNCEIGCACLG